MKLTLTEAKRITIPVASLQPVEYNEPMHRMMAGLELVSRYDLSRFFGHKGRHIRFMYYDGAIHAYLESGEVGHTNFVVPESSTYKDLFAEAKRCALICVAQLFPDLEAPYHVLDEFSEPRGHAQ
jgi:hypothetical protein